MPLGWRCSQPAYRKGKMDDHPSSIPAANGWIDETIPVHVPYTWNLNQSIGYESIYVTVVGAVLA
jgi:hypothetical protein